MPPKALSAYFIFAGEVRQTIHDEIAATNDGKASVALVGKAIGERWKQLSDEEKKRYQDKAKELKGTQCAYVIMLTMITLTFAFVFSVHRTNRRRCSGR